MKGRGPNREAFKRFPTVEKPTPPGGYLLDRVRKCDCGNVYLPTPEIPKCPTCRKSPVDKE